MNTNNRQPGLFCLCGRVIQEFIVKNQLKKFTLNQWKILFSKGLIIKELQHYPTTKRMLSDFKIQSELVENQNFFLILLYSMILQWNFN